MKDLSRKQRRAWIDANYGRERFDSNRYHQENFEILYILDNNSFDEIKEWFDKYAHTTGFNGGAEEGFMSVYKYNRLYEFVNGREMNLQ